MGQREYIFHTNIYKHIDTHTHTHTYIHIHIVVAAALFSILLIYWLQYLIFYSLMRWGRGVNEVQPLCSTQYP